MADTGYNWGSWADMTYNTGSDVDDIDLDDENTLTTDAYSNDGKAACLISVKWIEGNDGAPDGDLYIYILSDDADGNYQTIDDPAYSFSMDVVQNATRILVFNVDPKYFDNFKILVDNDSGQDGDLTLGIKTATIPAAS